MTAADYKASLLSNPCPSTITVRDLISHCEQVEAQRDALRQALEKVAAATNPDDEGAYRADDGQGCLDFVYATATHAIKLSHPA